VEGNEKGDIFPVLILAPCFSDLGYTPRYTLRIRPLPVRDSEGAGAANVGAVDTRAAALHMCIINLGRRRVRVSKSVSSFVQPNVA